MSSDHLQHAESIMKGILGSQILSVPFSCSLSAIAVLLAGRFISKTSFKSNYHMSYFQFLGGKSKPARLVLARWGAALVASICVAMTAMELAIVYQSAVVHAGDLHYLMRVPWTSSLVPLLTANFIKYELTSIVSIVTQTYFSDKTCHVVQRPKLFVPVLVLLGIGSLITGAAASISLFTIGLQTDGVDISASEAAFWAYLCFTTLSSLVIMIPLLVSHFRDTKVARIEASRTANSKGPTHITSLMRIFFSTYTMVFVFDFMCLITSVVSSAPHFKTALHASEAFLVLQKMMVRIMAISYLYALLDGIPKSSGFNPDIGTFNGSQFSSGANKSSFACRESQGPQDAKFSSRNLTSNSFGNYSLNKHRPLSSGDEEEGEEIFAFSYPPNATSPVGVEIPMGTSDPTPISAAFNNSHGNNYHQTQAQNSKHVMMDVDLRDPLQYTEPDQFPTLVGYSNNTTAAPAIPKKPKKPMVFVSHRNSPPPLNQQFNSLPAVPTVTHHQQKGSIPSFSDENVKKVKNQKKANQANRRFSSMKYTSGSASEFLLSAPTDHSNKDPLPPQSTKVAPPRKASRGASGYHRTVSDDDEDGEMSSMAAMGGRTS
ncbi:hypothetical protein CROQUDRAFT_97629 [Cronartium quercuum f. sp. fusiforme G11]|uniref:Uncharacterized protein n=1 Tax=Cronartium quercuum f. sp. fusiforme G11 TaxID=708437 RepID=A0A9P6NDT6_9BASI|nr:hypothetical protein CROQUDRAFT_97629 [Cronartium quercuum f. sp. fusiforme G11]